MRPETLNDLNYDYQCLRSNGVCAKTALKMLIMAYREHLK